MKILITGSGGFIGKHLVKTFSKRGYEVIATYRNKKPEIEGFVKLLKLDLSNRILQGLGPVEVVIHTAAVHPNYYSTPTVNDYINSNIRGTFNLAEYFKSMNLRMFVYLSTVSVYGRVEVDRLTEQTPLNMPDIYGLSKYMGEVLLANYTDHFSTLCIRLPGVVGLGNFTPWLGSVLKSVMENSPIYIYNPDSYFNNVVDLLELDKFLCFVIQGGLKRNFDIVNLSALEPITIREVVQLIVSLANSKSEIIEQPADKNSFSIDNEKLINTFKFEPATTKAIVERYVNETMQKYRKEVRGDK
jgi:nucleoside-diphosphate-sugar epimerase